MKQLCALCALMAFHFQVPAQAKEKSTAPPALVVGIVVDQMRYDYIYRYWERFGDNGFRRLINSGYYFKNAHFNYIPTYTAPGHSSIYTGATPRVHGIIGNDWYSRSEARSVSAVYDANVSPLGTAGDKGKMSPARLLSSTIGDELKMTYGNAKVFSVSLKDRAAGLPGGHAANGAFWIDETGDFVSSGWYMKELPTWLQDFNSKKLVKEYLSRGWNTLYPITSYTNSLPDDNPFENKFGRDKPVFPYDYKADMEKGNW